MAGKVLLREEALADLFEIWLFVAEASGPDRADALDARLRAACMKLGDFPRRGTPHDTIAPGVRSVAFKRRATIYYRVADEDVEIIRVLYAGRDHRKAFGGK